MDFTLQELVHSEDAKLRPLEVFFGGGQLSQQLVILGPPRHDFSDWGLLG